MIPAPPTSSAELKDEVERLKVEVTGLETRFIQVFSNAFSALRSGTWSSAQRRAAIYAALRFIFLGKPVVIVSVGAGALLALHANALLSEQNRKVFIQSYVNTTNAYLLEAQRISQVTPIVLDLLQSIEREAGTRTPGTGVTRLSTQTAQRIVYVSNLVRPYRVVVEAEQSNVPGLGIGILRQEELIDVPLQPISLGETEPQHWIFRWTRTIFGFDDPGTDRIENLPLPLLSRQRSPERGLLLQSLVVSGADVRSRELDAASFDYAFARNIVGDSFAFPKKLRGVDLGSASLVKSDFSGSQLPFASLRAADATDAGFERALMMAADVQAATLTRANLRDALLSFTNFRNAKLDSADLTGANLLGADFEGASLAGAKVTPEALYSAKVTRTTAGLPATFDWARYETQQGRNR